MVSEIEGENQVDWMKRQLEIDQKSMVLLYEEFEVDEAVMMESQMVKHTTDDDCADNGISLPNVSSKILWKMTEYCKRHVDASFTHQQ